MAADPCPERVTLLLSAGLTKCSAMVNVNLQHADKRNSRSFIYEDKNMELVRSSREPREVLRNLGVAITVLA